ncbi:MAG: RNA polymerase sigma factor SigJ [Chloroflexia bacterium]|nr:RNA polymerase sigma factor SigJ [Chloroflexia bacterium]
MSAADLQPIAGAFGDLRPYFFTVAYRMTGSASDAEDLVQESWVRYVEAGAPEVRSVRAYFTAVVSRLCLDYLKSASVRREQYVGPWLPEPVLTREAVAGPAETVEQREAVSVAFLTLLERLGPEQRVVYVLREAIGLSYDEIAEQLGKTAAGCRQVFHRAQRRLASGKRHSIAPLVEHRALTEHFLAALDSGDAARVAVLLAVDAAWIGDGGSARQAARRPIVGADRISRGLVGLLGKLTPDMRLTFELADINGAAAAVVRQRGEVDGVMLLAVDRGRIATVWYVRNPDKLRHLERSLRTEP